MLWDMGCSNRWPVPNGSLPAPFLDARRDVNLSCDLGRASHTEREFLLLSYTFTIAPHPIHNFDLFPGPRKETSRLPGPT